MWSCEVQRRVERPYVTGLLGLHHKSLAEMRRHALLPFSIRHGGALLAADPLPHRKSLPERLRAALPGGVFAVDLMPVRHEGSALEGVGRVYSSSDNGVIWGTRD